MRTLRQLAADEKEYSPNGDATLLSSVYIYDVLAEAATVEETTFFIRHGREGRTTTILSMSSDR